MSGPLPPGIAVGEGAREAMRLSKQVIALCAEHRVNAIVDLPPEPFQQAMTLQSRIDAIRQRQRDALVSRGLRGLAKAQANARARFAARLNEFRKAVADRGGLAAVNKVRLARELGIARSTVQKYLRVLAIEREQGPPRCYACGQPVPEPEELSVEADTRKHNAAATRRGEQRT